MNDNIEGVSHTKDYDRYFKPQIIEDLLIKQAKSRVLDFSDRYVGDEGVKMIINHLKANDSKPEQLLLRGNKLSAYSLQSILAYLKESPFVRHLSLEWNQINNPKDLEEFCIGVNLTGLWVLDLKSNGIGGNCTDALISLFNNENNLLEVDLGWNDLTNTCASKILDSLQRNNRLISLGLRGSGISKPILDKIESVCTRNMDNDPGLIDILHQLKAGKAIKAEEMGLKPDKKDSKYADKLVKDNLVEYLKEDLDMEKNTNKDLLGKIQTLTDKKNEQLRHTADLEHQVERLSKDNEFLLLENKNLRLELEKCKGDSKETINRLNEDIRVLKLNMENKSKEFALKVEAQKKESKHKVQETVEQWESW